MVPKTGLEPALPKEPDSKSGVSTHFHHFGIIYLVPETGLEPARLSTAGLKPAVSTHFHHSGIKILVLQVGIEPTQLNAPVLQTGVTLQLHRYSIMAEGRAIEAHSSPEEPLVFKTKPVRLSGLPSILNVLVEFTCDCQKRERLVISTSPLRYIFVSQS